jgi:hypothetical protein
MSIYNCTTTTNPIPCVDPLTYLLNMIGEWYDAGTINSINETLDYVLDLGLVLNSCNFCCDSCEYILASAETYYLYTTPAVLPAPGAVESSNGLDFKCCFNIFVSSQIIFQYPDTFADNSSFLITGNLNSNLNGQCGGGLSCCNGFNECVLEIGCGENCFDLIRLLDKGIVERQSPNKPSRLCELIEFLKKYNTGEKCIVEDLDRLLDKGLIIYCDDKNRIIIGSRETVSNYKNLENPGAPLP